MCLCVWSDILPSLSVELQRTWDYIDAIQTTEGPTLNPLKYTFSANDERFLSTVEYIQFEALEIHLLVLVSVKNFKAIINQFPPLDLFKKVLLSYFAI